MGRKPIGTGDYKETFVNPEDERKVISVLKKREGEEKITPKNLKGAYYLTKIAHILLPKSVPDIYQAGESADGQQTFDRERIAHTPGHRALQEAREAGVDEERAKVLISKEMGQKINNVTNDLAEIGFAFHLDENAGNYNKDEDGDVKYLETFMPWGINPEQPDELELLFEKDDLEEAISKISDDQQRATCQRYLDRLLVLFEEEKRDFEGKQESSSDHESLVQEFITLVDDFERKHNLEELLAITTQKEALESAQRATAKKDIALISSELNKLGEIKGIPIERYKELYERYKKLDHVIGIISKGVVYHDR